MYSVADFAGMTGDAIRIDAFRKALSSAIRPDSVVLDLGAGTGIMTMLACRYGARHVYAIEPSDVIQIAMETAAVNGFLERIAFVQKPSTAVTLPERVDVIVEDMGGAMPWFGTHLADVIDARDRFLAPDGCIIPQEDVAYCAIVEADSLYQARLGPWLERPEGLDLSPALRYAASSWMRGNLKREQLMSQPHAWASIEYASVRSCAVKSKLSLRVEREGTAHGLLMWFDRTLADAVKIMNGPGEAETIYGPRFWPWPQPVSLIAGGQVDVVIRADPVGSDYIWTLETWVHRADAKESQHFIQSTFLATPMTQETRARRASGFRPKLNDEGKFARYVLEQMEESLSIAEIADRLGTAFPGQFPTPRKSLDFVVGIAARYGN